MKKEENDVSCTEMMPVNPYCRTFQERSRMVRPKFMTLNDSPSVCVLGVCQCLVLCILTFLLFLFCTGSFSFSNSLVGARNINMESIYDYGSRCGFWRLHRLFTAKKLPVTVFAVGMALERNIEACGAMKEADWEVS